MMLRLEPGLLRIIARFSVLTLPVGTSRHARKTPLRSLASLICGQNPCDRPRTRNRPICSSSQFALGSTVRANNPLSNRRRWSRTPISLNQ